MFIRHEVVLFLQSTSSPPLVLTDSRESETRARVKITPREKGETRWGAACRLFSRGAIFKRARVSLALLSLRTNGELPVVYLLGNFGRCSSSRYWKLPKFEPDFLAE